jgi:hypothetical protein
LFAGTSLPSSVGVIGELQGLAGDFAGGLVFGDSNTTLVGVALIRNERRGESATLVGESDTGGLFTGEKTGAAPCAGDKVIMGSLRGDSSPGNREKRLLRRRVDRFIICFSSIFDVASTGSSEAALLKPVERCESATVCTPFSFFGSMGQRELWRFLGIHFKVSGGNVEDLVLGLLRVLAVAAASSLAVKTKAGFGSSDRVAQQL